LTFPACSSTPNPPPTAAEVSGKGFTTVDPLASVGGDHTVYIEAVSATVIVAMIDYPSSRVLLKRADGSQFACKIGKAAVNFDRIKVGDEIVVTLAEQCVTYIGKVGTKPGVEVDALVVRVLANGVPSGAEVTKVDFDAKVMDVNLDNRRILVKTGSDEAQSFRVLPNVNLANIHDNDMISMRVTEAVAVEVEPPSASTQQ
jgi:hypothetical protein